MFLISYRTWWRKSEKKVGVGVSSFAAKDSRSLCLVRVNVEVLVEPGITYPQHGPLVEVVVEDGHWKSVPF